jgi:hypothetical protein
MYGAVLHSVLFCTGVDRGMDLEAWIPIPLGPPLSPLTVSPSRLASRACLAYGSRL